MATLRAPEYSSSSSSGSSSSSSNSSSSRPGRRTYRPNKLGVWLLKELEPLGECGKVDCGGRDMLGTVWSVGSLGG